MICIILSFGGLPEGIGKKTKYS